MTYRLRYLPRFPANISGADGVTVERDGGDLVVKPDFGALVRVPAVIDPGTAFFMVWQEESNSYIIMAFNDVFDAVSGLGFMQTSVYDPQEIGDDVFDRANHTGAQAISTVTGLQTALDDISDDIDTNSLTAKTTPVDADVIRLADSAASFGFKKLTFANLKAWIKSWLPVSSSFVSSEQTITSAGALTIAHGLGVKPTVVVFVLVCKTSEFGYSVNDEIYLGPVGTATSADDNRGFVCTFDATNISIRFGANATVFSLITKSGGTGATLTNTNWRLVVKALS